MAMNLDSLAALYLRRDSKSRAGLIALCTADKLVRNDPEQAWEFILRLVAQARDDRDLAYIAAGPLEDLLNLHGLAFIGRVDVEWQRNEKMRRAISAVWLS
jgi:hypothetical protein